MATFNAILADLPGLLTDRLDLLFLELQRAGQVVLQMVALIVAAAILGVTAWLALWAGVVVALVELGWHWSVALLTVLLLNAAVAIWAVLRLRRLLPALQLPRTRRHLSLEPQGAASAPSPAPAPDPSAPA